MPTKKKRIGFIPREEVMNIIIKLSFENNISNSKVISILVEEALASRGIFNTKTGEEKEIFKRKNILNTYVLKNKNDNKNQVKIDGLDKNTIISNNFTNTKTNNENFNLETYEKFMLFLKYQEMIKKYEK